MKTIFIIFHAIFIFSFSLTNSQWIQTSGPAGGIVYSLENNNSVIYAGTSTGVFVSNNEGLNWNSTSLHGRTNAIAIAGTTILAGTGGNGSYGIFVTTNGGQNWVQTLSSIAVYSIVVNASNIFGGAADGTYLSANDGLSWQQISPSPTVFALAAQDPYVFAGTGSGGVYQSSNSGINWIQNVLGINHYIFSLAINGSTIYAGAGSAMDEGVYISTNYGSSWTRTLNGHFVRSLARSGTNIIAGTNGNGVYISTNNGASWIQKNEGMGNQNIYSLLITSNHIYAGSGSSVWKRPLLDLIGIESTNSSIPHDHHLYQNYPNPFNPSTVIKYDVKAAGTVKIKIFDAVGKVVSTLVNEKQNPGVYEATWLADKSPSGIYFSLFEIDNFTQTRKMVLIK